MPRQEGKTSRKSQGRAVDGVWEEKKDWDAPSGRKNLKKKSRKSSRRGIGREKGLGCPARKGKTSRKSQGRTVGGAWEEKKVWNAPPALTLTFHIGVV